MNIPFLLCITFALVCVCCCKLSCYSNWCCTLAFLLKLNKKIKLINLNPIFLIFFWLQHLTVLYGIYTGGLCFYAKKKSDISCACSCALALQNYKTHVDGRVQR